MTEDEAKTKWCPHARVATYATGGGLMIAANKTIDGKVRTGATCIASACMAWRWNPMADQVKAIREAFETHIQDAVRLARNEQRPATHGYCGLAGRPG